MPSGPDADRKCRGALEPHFIDGYQYYIGNNSNNCRRLAGTAGESARTPHYRIRAHSCQLGHISVHMRIQYGPDHTAHMHTRWTTVCWTQQPSTWIDSGTPKNHPSVGLAAAPPLASSSAMPPRGSCSSARARRPSAAWPARTKCSAGGSGDEQCRAPNIRRARAPRTAPPPPGGGRSVRAHTGPKCDRCVR